MTQLLIWPDVYVVNVLLRECNYGVYSCSPESRPVAVPPICQRGSEHVIGPSALPCTHKRAQQGPG